MPSKLASNTLRAFEDIYGYCIGLVNMDRDPIHVGAAEAIPGATNLTMAPKAHAFSKQALLEQEPILAGYVDKFVDNPRRVAWEGTAANLVSWFNFCTFDIIGDLSLASRLGVWKKVCGHFNPSSQSSQKGWMV